MYRGLFFFRASSTCRTTRTAARSETVSPSFSAARVDSSVSGSSSQIPRLLIRKATGGGPYQRPKPLHRVDSALRTPTLPCAWGCVAGYAVGAWRGWELSINPAVSPEAEDGTNSEDKPSVSSLGEDHEHGQKGH